MNRLMLSDNINKSEIPKDGMPITYMNYKYRIYFDGSGVVELYQNNDLMLKIKHVKNDYLIEGVVYDIIMNKKITQEQGIKESWSMIYQVSMLCEIK